RPHIASTSLKPATLKRRTPLWRGAEAERCLPFCPRLKLGDLPLEDRLLLAQLAHSARAYLSRLQAFSDVGKRCTLAIELQLFHLDHVGDGAVGLERKPETFTPLCRLVRSLQGLLGHPANLIGVGDARHVDGLCHPV